MLKTHYQYIYEHRAFIKKLMRNYRSNRVSQINSVTRSNFVRSILFYFFFSTAWGWSTSHSLSLIFRSRIVIITYPDRYGIYQWEHALLERYVTVQHREAPTISYGTGTLSNPLVVRHTCTHVSLVVPPTFANIFPDVLLRPLK